MPIATSSDTSFGLSKISNTADYLAINSDDSYFLELSQSDLLHCSITELKHCPKPFTFNHADSLTCTLSLFRGIKEHINTRCDFDLIVSPVDAKSVQYVNNGIYFIGFHNGSYFHEICRGLEPRKIVSCSLCLIKPRCGWSIESDAFFIPPSINGCDHFKDTEVVHPVNLMVPSELNGLAVHFDPLPLNVLFSKPIKLDMPDLDIYSADMNQIAHNDKQVAYDLKRLAKLCQQQKSIFASTADKLVHDIGRIGKRYSNVYLLSASTL